MIMNFGFVFKNPRINVANVCTHRCLHIHITLWYEQWTMNKQMCKITIERKCYAFGMAKFSAKQMMKITSDDDDRSEANGPNNFTYLQF